MKRDKYSMEEEPTEKPKEEPKEEIIDEDDDEWNKEPEVVEVIGNLRLDPEAAKRYREILKARQKSDGRSFL